MYPILKKLHGSLRKISIASRSRRCPSLFLSFDRVRCLITLSIARYIFSRHPVAFPNFFNTKHTKQITNLCTLWKHEQWCTEECIHVRLLLRTSLSINIYTYWYRYGLWDVCACPTTHPLIRRNKEKQNNKTLSKIHKKKSCLSFLYSRSSALLVLNFSFLHLFLSLLRMTDH